MASNIVKLHISEEERDRWNKAAEDLKRILRHELLLPLANGSKAGYSQNNFTNELKRKLDEIEERANRYIHPPTHPASMITGLSECNCEGGGGSSGGGGGVGWDGGGGGGGGSTSSGGGSDIVSEQLGSNGYVKFKNGLIIQWVGSRATHGGYDTISWPISFSRGCFSVTVSEGHALGWDTRTPGQYGHEPSGSPKDAECTVYGRFDGGSNSSCTIMGVWCKPGGQVHKFGHTHYNAIAIGM